MALPESIVTLSADNHRLLDFLFRFPQIFFSKCVSRKNWKWITYRVAAMNQNVVWISLLLLVSQIKSIIIFRFYVVWYYEKKKKSTTLQAMILGKITWKYMCWDRSTFRLTQSQTQVNLKMVQRRLLTVRTSFDDKQCYC